MQHSRAKLESEVRADFVANKLDAGYFLQQIRVNADQIKTVAQQTMQQIESPLWHL